MKYDIAALSSQDVAIAQKHAIGGEKKLWATSESAVEIGEITMPSDGSGVGSGVYTPNSINTIPNTGYDLVCSVNRQLVAAADCVVTFNVTFDDSTTGQAACTFSAPSWVAIKSSDFEHGVARDLNGTAGNSAKKIVSINSLASVTNAKRFSGFKIWALPQVSANWQYISHVESFDPVIGTNPGIPIPDGLEGTSEVVRGRSEPSALDITALHRAVIDNIMRFAGREVCFRCETWAGGVVVKERQIAVNCVLQVNPTMPDGNEMMKNVARGFMQKWFGFWAG